MDALNAFCEQAKETGRLREFMRAKLLCLLACAVMLAGCGGYEEVEVAKSKPNPTLEIEEREAELLRLSKVINKMIRERNNYTDNIKSHSRDVARHYRDPNYSIGGVHIVKG